ncbi:mechanosensitive ion channel family protein [Sphingomonas flavalba]|uniref:mechanosensitive ion channel family protein n=1 Tax=Sphingomonas flavalba TaxID=2559804 RepID=UPI00109DAB55|nr:mechanosensitive ion channel domain-containing protein [Sphingomonas flavalba]
MPAEIAALWTAMVDWLQTHSAQIILGVIAAAAIALLFRFIRSLGEKLCHRMATEPGWATIIGRTIARTGNLFIFALSARLVVHFAQAPQPVAEVFNFIFVVITAFQAAMWARELIIGFIEYRSDAGEHEALGNAINIIRLLVTVALFAIALILVLDNLGVNVTGLVAGLGIGGIAIGLAAQGIFKDLFAALSILFDKPFRRGDTIKFDTDLTGQVEAIGLKTTRIRSVDGDQLVVSNDKLLGDVIRNLRGITNRRVVLNLPLLYTSDPALLEQLPAALKAIVEAESDCRFDHAWLTAFDTNGLTLELMFHVRAGADRMMEARHAIMIATIRRLHEVGLRLFSPPPAPEPEPRQA